MSKGKKVLLAGRIESLDAYYEIIDDNEYHRLYLFWMWSYKPCVLNRGIIVTPSGEKIQFVEDEIQFKGKDQATLWLELYKPIPIEPGKYLLDIGFKEESSYKLLDFSFIEEASNG